MRSRWTALLTVLVLLGLTPRGSNAQVPPPQTAPRKSVPAGGLGSAFPNPMNPQTWISFTVGDPPSCTDSGKQHSVTLLIRNTLAQPVAYPVIQGGSISVAGGLQINRLMLPCSPSGYRAYWNGKYGNSQQEAASGIYFYELVVDGRKVGSKQLTVAK
jgi:hypothetical protein